MCEKCWSDAYSRELADTSKSQGEHHQELIRERIDNPCTPEEQCGEMHLVIKWKDGTKHCICGEMSR